MHIYTFALPMKVNYSKIFFIIMAVVLLGDLVFSYLQYNCSVIDGDVPNIVLGQNGYDQVLHDPLGAATWKGETYVGTNRYTAHKFMSVYFKTLPFVFQNFMSPINSVYLSITLAKFGIHLLLLWVMSYYVSVWFKWAKWKSYVVAGAIMTPFFIGGNMYVEHLAIIDACVTYAMFYPLPLAILLLFLIPFYKYYVNGTISSSPWFIASWSFFALVMVFFGPLPAALLLIIVPMFGLGLLWRSYQRQPIGARGLLPVLKGLNRTIVILLCITLTFALYSFYVGTKNSESVQPMELSERFGFLFQGIKEVFLTTESGVGYLFIATVISVALLTFLYRKEQKTFLYLVAGLAVFCVLYVFLLPLGGYRSYRPLLLRRDTTLPVNMVLMFVFTTASMLLLKSYSGKNKVYPLLVIVVVCLHFEAADMQMPTVYSRRDEREFMEIVAASKEDCVLLERWTPIASWWQNPNCEESEAVANLLYFYHITPRKIYVHYKEHYEPRKE